MPERFDPILNFVSQKTDEGNLYLFPEYSEYAESLTLNTVSDAKVLQAKNSREGTRQILHIQNPDLNFSFVAKEERSADNKFRLKYNKQGHNLTLRELLIGRSLSQLATFEDDEMIVKFEEPIGYHENTEGRRIGLFKYIPEMSQERLWSTPLNKIMQSLKEELDNRLKNLQKGSYEYSTLQYNYWNLISRIKQIFFSGEFARLVMNQNGVRHNEFLTEKDGYYEDPETQKRIAHLIDFELCQLLDEQQATTYIKKQIRDLIITDGIDTEDANEKSYVEILHDFLKKDSHQALPTDQLQLLLEFEEAFFNMKKRIASVLKLDTEDMENNKWKRFQLEEVGPAFSMVQNLPKQIGPLIVHNK